MSDLTTEYNQAGANPRIHGKAPFDVVVVHGGPGLGGEMTPVARELAIDRGVLEPMQTAASLEGQTEELRTILAKHTDPPVTLIGFSWGAWLSYIIAARYHAFVKKLILISSGPFQEKYAARIQETRFNRLNEGERREIESLVEVLADRKTSNLRLSFKRFGELFSRADTYSKIVSGRGDYERIDYRPDIFQKVWPEAMELRRSGRLLKLGKRIKCPVVGIHGDYDPHPALGVRKPLSVLLGNFRFVLLKNCGHKPWIEQEAHKRFWQVLKEELRKE